MWQEEILEGRGQADEDGLKAWWKRERKGGRKEGRKEERKEGEGKTHSV